MSGLAFVDTETTGLDPDRHEIWEVGLITPDGREWEWQLPVDLTRADPIALDIGRFHDRRNDRAHDTLDDFARDFVGLTRGLHMAGAVVSFDAERLWKLLRAAGQCPMWHYHLVDVEALAAGWVSAQCDGRANDGGRGLFPVVDAEEKIITHIDGRPPWDSNHLSRAVGVDPKDFDRHTALGDCRWAKAIYDAVMGR